MTTLAVAVAAVRERLDEPTAAQWSDESIRRWLGEGARDVARRTRHYWDIDTIDVSADDGEYTVDADVLHIKHVYYNTDSDTTRQIPLEARAFEAMNQVWHDRQNQASSWPSAFTTFGYAPTLTIKLFPVPSENGTLTLHVARLPAAVDVAGGTGNLDVPEAWLEVTYDYAEYMALRKDRDPRWQESFGMYEGKVQGIIEMGEYINAPGEFVHTASGVYPSWLTDWG
jgi:hypothetical protein